MRKAYIVTGASGAIGREVVSRLVAQGSPVIACTRSIVTVEAMSRDVLGTIVVPARAEAKVVDAAVLEATRLAAAGGARVAGLLACGGATANQLMLRSSDELFEEMLEANFMSTMRLTRSVLRHSDLLKTKDGVFVGLSSVVASRGNAGQVAYAASKAALEGAYRSLAKEYGPRGVRFVVVAPGLIESPMAATAGTAAQEDWVARTSLKRLGRPDEVAEAIVGVVGMRYFTGEVLTVAGGA
jgi:3-oxoacyl-[acyl-carrier protein] reductase